MVARAIKLKIAARTIPAVPIGLAFALVSSTGSASFCGIESTPLNGCDSGAIVGDGGSPVVDVLLADV